MPKRLASRPTRKRAPLDYTGQEKGDTTPPGCSQGATRRTTGLANAAGNSRRLASASGPGPELCSSAPLRGAPEARPSPHRLTALAKRLLFVAPLGRDANRMEEIMIVADFTALIDAIASLVWAVSKLVWSIRRPP